LCTVDILMLGTVLQLDAVGQFNCLGAMSHSK
jgi:hypothetical protein